MLSLIAQTNSNGNAADWDPSADGIIESSVMQPGANGSGVEDHVQRLLRGAAAAANGEMPPLPLLSPTTPGMVRVASEASVASDAYKTASEGASEPASPLVAPLVGGLSKSQKRRAQERKAKERRAAEK